MTTSEWVGQSKLNGAAQSAAREAVRQVERAFSQKLQEEGLVSAERPHDHPGFNISFYAQINLGGRYSGRILAVLRSYPVVEEKRFVIVGAKGPRWVRLIETCRECQRRQREVHQREEQRQAELARHTDEAHSILRSLGREPIQRPTGEYEMRPGIYLKAHTLGLSVEVRLRVDSTFAIEVYRAISQILDRQDGKAGEPGLTIYERLNEEDSEMV